MKKIRKHKWLLFIVLIICLTLTALGGSRPNEDQYIHVGIAVYDLDDTFMNSLITALENRIDEVHMKKKISYEICDAKGNSRRQNKQLQYMYTQSYDMMLVNLVDPSSAASVLNNAKELDIPVILFNRDIAEKDLKITDNVWYVGTDASQAGQIQGEMLHKIWKEQRNRVDKNKNGKIDYVLIEGEEDHYDAIRRTKGFLENSKDLPLNTLGTLSASWNRQLAYKKFSQLDNNAISSTEAVICNNDDMALGVYDYYKEKNLALPIILGINNSQEMNEKIMSGEIYGSVDNDMDKQVLRIVKCMESVLNGNTKKYKKVWYSTPFAVTRE